MVGYEQLVETLQAYHDKGPVCEQRSKPDHASRHIASLRCSLLLPTGITFVLPYTSEGIWLSILGLDPHLSGPDSQRFHGRPDAAVGVLCFVQTNVGIHFGQRCRHFGNGHICHHVRSGWPHEQLLVPLMHSDGWQ